MSNITYQIYPDQKIKSDCIHLNFLPLSKSILRSTIQLILLGAFFCSCVSEVSERIIVTEFPVKQEVQPVIIQTPPVILAPEAIFVMNDQLWIFQERKELMFDVFSLPECNYLFSTGSKGRGPDEFIFPEGQTIQAEKDNFTIIDGIEMKTIVWRPDYGLHTIKSEIVFDQLTINGFIRLNDSLYCSFADCATGTTSDFEFQMINTADGTINKFSAYPEDLSQKKFDGDRRCQIYIKLLAANPTKRKFVSLYNYFKFFRIYSYEGIMEKEIEVRIPPYQVDDVDDWQKRFVFYGKPVVTEQYIYAYCSANKEIQVWDWNGNPVVLYSLDQKYYCFTVSEKHKKLFLISTADENLDKIFVFDLTHLR